MSTAASRRDAAIKRVRDNADPVWLDYAYAAAWTMSQTWDTFTTDDVWALLGNWKVDKPREPRAMGSVLMTMVRAKDIEKTGEYVSSTRAECNRRPIPVYRRVDASIR